MDGMPSGRVTARAVRELVAAAVPGLAERMMVERVEREWVDTVGPELARGTFLLDLDRGILAVGAESSVCLQELTLRGPDIVAALGRRFPGVVAAIRPCPRRRPTEPEVPAPPPGPPASAALTTAEAESVARLVAAIPDPDVAAAVRRVLVKDHLARRARPARAHAPEPPGAPPPSAPGPASESPDRLTAVRGARGSAGSRPPHVIDTTPHVIDTGSVRRGFR
jgi:hypothetical protein